LLLEQLLPESQLIAGQIALRLQWLVQLIPLVRALLVLIPEMAPGLTSELAPEFALAHIQTWRTHPAPRLEEWILLKTCVCDS
jgi:hypothetical protein